jgi:hypothetical protein
MSPSSHPAPPLRSCVTQGRAAPPNSISTAALRARADVLLWALSFLSSYLLLSFLLCDHPPTHSSEELPAATAPRCFQLPTQHLPSFLHQLLQAPSPGLSFPSARSITTSFPDLLAYFALGAASIAAAHLAPSWYLLRGSIFVLPAAQLITKTVAVGQLLLQRRPLDPAQQEWFQLYHLGARGLLLLTVVKLCFAVSTTLRSVYLLTGAVERTLAHAGCSRTQSGAASRRMQRVNAHSALGSVCSLQLHRDCCTGFWPAPFRTHCAWSLQVFQ